MTIPERAAALRVEGQAATANMRPVQGARRLRAALRLLDRAKEPAGTEALRGRILISLAYAEADQGHIESGWRLLTGAGGYLPPRQRGARYGQRGIFLSRIGRDD